jgi:hypothetical protein
VAGSGPRTGEADVLPALVLGFENVNEERILRGVEVLGGLVGHGRLMSHKLRPLDKRDH